MRMHVFCIFVAGNNIYLGIAVTLHSMMKSYTHERSMDILKTYWKPNLITKNIYIYITMKY